MRISFMKFNSFGGEYIFSLARICIVKFVEYGVAV